MCSSMGSTWEFQFPEDWISQMVEDDKLKNHFEYWQKGITDKQGHFFWFISGGPGSGKSRCLDEFPKILRAAVSRMPNCEDFRKRLDDMCVFKFSFENGKKSRGGIPDIAMLPAHMAYQLQESSMSWPAFSQSRVAENMTFDVVVDRLLTIRQAVTVRDLTILILIDSLQEATDALLNIVSMICDLTNAAAPFVMVACSATVQIPIRDFLKTSGQHFIYLTPPPISEPFQIAMMCDSLPTENRLLAKIMIQDMGGHGRALEYLFQIFVSRLSAASKPSVLMGAVKESLRYAYPGWNPFKASSRAQVESLIMAIVCGQKLTLYDTIPGTDLTVDRIVQVGLFRFDVDKQKLSVAFIWMILMCDWIESPELQAVIGLDHDQLLVKLQDGKHPTLSLEAFEEFWCNFRALRSRCYRNEARVKWYQIHSGAYFSKNGDFEFVNRHLTFAKAVHQFGTKSSSQDLIQIEERTSPLRDQFLDKIILNKSSAPSGNSMVVLKLPDASALTEAHQYKQFDVSKMSIDKVLVERNKAADTTDSFILISAGKFDKRCLERLPKRTAVIDAECFEAYFGPFAGRAYVYRNTSPIDVNTACRYQLNQCLGIGEKIAKSIIDARKVRAFSGPDDFAQRIRNFPPCIMEQFLFLQPGN